MRRDAPLGGSAVASGATPFNMKKNVFSHFACLLLAGQACFAAIGPGSSVPLPRPLTLEVATAYALEHSPSLLRTQEQLREQEGVLMEAKSSRLPSLDAKGSQSRTSSSALEFPAIYENDNWSVDVTVSQTLFAGGAVRAGIRAQREQVEAAKLTYTAAVNDTLLSVQQLFYQVLLGRELIGVQEEALRVLETELVNTRNRRDAGTGSDFDVLRSEVAVANARPGLIRARNAYHVAQDQLRATLGASAEDGSRPTDLEVQGTLEMPLKDISLADAIAGARANRPELLKSERLVKAAEQAVVVAHGRYYPAVAVFASYGWANPTQIATPRSNLNGLSTGVQANWNIFEGRATASRVTQAKARVNQARYGAVELALGVEVELRHAHSSLTEAKELLASMEKVVAQARESLRMARARYEAGTATQVDVLLAQSALTEAHSNLVQAQYSYAVAKASLVRAMGFQ